MADRDFRDQRRIGCDGGQRGEVFDCAARRPGSTPRPTVTPTALDQNVTQAALTTCDTDVERQPHDHGSSAILQWGMHQRATYRWVAYDYTKFLRIAGRHGKGLVHAVGRRLSGVQRACSPSRFSE
jgi:hypothetical protein